MREVGWRAERRLIEPVEHRQPARKELAIDGTLRKSLDAAKAQAACELVETFAGRPGVARLAGGEPVAHDHPVDRLAIGATAALARATHQLGIVLRAHQLRIVSARGVALEWRDQGIRQRMDEPDQI